MQVERSINAKKVVLITSGQPSLNPRLVKEADALAEAGYHVSVFYQYWNKWGTEKDTRLLSGKKWNAVLIGGDPVNNKLIYWISRILHKAAKIAVVNLGFGSYFAEASAGRCAILLMKKVQSIKADIYIAHNMAALPAAVNAAKANHSKSGFDAEDFHRYENSNDSDNFDVKLAAFIESKYFPRLNYLTTSSPDITSEYSRLFPELNPQTILNVFPKKTDSLPPTTDRRTLKLFWFSQTVGLSRGLEQLIEAIGINKAHNIQLHLLGDCDKVISQKLYALVEIYGLELKDLFLYEPIDPDMIIDFASQFDIGIAAETGYPHNRDVCLTNKLFTYIQSGLAVIASDTVAQKRFMGKYPLSGILYKKNDAHSLSEAISYYAHNPEKFSETRKYNIELGQSELNWDIEKEKFITVVGNTVGK